MRTLLCHDSKGFDPSIMAKETYPKVDLRKTTGKSMKEMRYGRTSLVYFQSHCFGLSQSNSLVPIPLSRAV